MNDMVDILTHLQKLVPGARNEEELHNNAMRDDTSRDMSPIPVGGDQLTCERIRGAHMARFDADEPEERLEGLICMVEDFHEKMNFLQVIMDKYFKGGSCREVGTLFQLKNLLNRRNVAKDVSSNYHADSEFIDLVTECHVVAAVMEQLNMVNTKSSCNEIPAAIHLADTPTKKRVLTKVIGGVVDSCFMNEIVLSINRLDDINSLQEEQKQDHVFNYAANLSKLGLMRRICVEATRYGDGMRLMRHWKFALLIYHQAHKVKYRLESFLLQAGVNALYTARQRHQIIHNRFVNLSGGDGHNLDGDYVMELLNKYAKSRVKLLGPNHSEECVDRIGKTMMFCHDLQEKLERHIHIAPSSRSHTSQSLGRDKEVMLQQLSRAQVFKRIPGRSHLTFSTENVDIFGEICVKTLQEWIAEKKQEYAERKYAF